MSLRDSGQARPSGLPSQLRVNRVNHRNSIDEDGGDVSKDSVSYTLISVKDNYVVIRMDVAN